MGSQGTQTIASFKGKLQRLEKTEGASVVQLIFREDGKDWLCVSTNPVHASLRKGKTYRIEGVFRSVSGRPFIQQPRIQAMTRGIWPHKVMISLAVVVAVMGGGVVGVKALNGSDGAAEPPKTSSTQSAPAAQQGNTLGANNETATQAADASAPPEPTAASAATPSTTKRRTSSSQTSTAPTIPAAPTPAAEPNTPPTAEPTPEPAPEPIPDPVPPPDPNPNPTPAEPDPTPDNPPSEP